MSRPEVREAFQVLLDEHLPPEKLVRCIVEGLDANQVKFFSREGDVIETVVLPDHRVRLLFVVLALKLKGWDTLPAEEPLPWRGGQSESDEEQKIVALASVFTSEELERLSEPDRRLQQ